MMKRLLLALGIFACAATGALGQGKTPGTLTTEIGTNLPDNNIGFITPALVRQTLTDMVNSYALYGASCPTGMTNFQGFTNTTGAPSSALLTYWDGTACVPWAALNQTNHSIVLASNTGVGTGKARMTPSPSYTNVPTNTAAYLLTDPFGNTISCATTTTQCLQEFLNTTTANGWPAEVDCRGILFPSATQPVVINTSSSVTVPVAQDWSFHSYGCNLNINVTSASGLIVDSEGASVFDWDGLVVYNPTAPNGDVTTNPSCAVYIHPTTHTGDGFAGLYAGYFRVKNPSSNAQGGTVNTAAVCMDISGGVISNEEINFTEINAAGFAYHGILALGAPSASGSQMSVNIITATQVHGTQGTAVKIGSSATNQTYYNDNIWNIGSISTGTANTIGIDTYGSKDHFTLGADGGLGASNNCSYAVQFESGAKYNKAWVGDITGCTSGQSNDLDGSNAVEGYSTTFQPGVQYSLPQVIGTGAGGSQKSAVLVQNSTGLAAVGWGALGSGTDAKFWDFGATGNTLTLRAINDGGSSANTAFQCTRSGFTISSCTFPAGTLTLGTAGTAVGALALANASSGTVSIEPPTGALGSAVLTAPDLTDTLAVLGHAQTFTATQTFGASAANVIINGNTTPQIVFQPSSGNTKTSEFYQTGDVWYVATPGVGNDFFINLTTPFSAGTTNGGFNVGAQADPGAGFLNVVTGYKNNGVLMVSASAPTISSGFCATSPSISASNGTAAFDINVGTSCSGNTGTIGMPAATTGWVCSFADVTTPASFIVSQTGGATNTVTLTNYSRTTGNATTFTASDHIRANCHGY